MHRALFQPRVAAALLVCAAGAGLVRLAHAGLSLPVPAAAAPAIKGGLPAPPVTGVLVYISGAVSAPGLYRVPRGDRVFQALQLAGGVLGDADPARLPNMAARVRDGMQVKVPFLGGGSGGLKVNINLATRDELLAIPGLSPSMADAILSYRDGYGGFESLRELVTVLGLDAYDYDFARRHLTL